MAKAIDDFIAEYKDRLAKGLSGYTKQIGDFREGFNNLLRVAGAEIDADKKKHTLYCLRHFYITERLREGIPIYEIASNCGTSVSMIEKYYSDARPTDFMDRLTKSRYPKKQPPS
jgi:hypothetical protein